MAKRCDAGCVYSRSLDQPYPRNCVHCGCNESTDHNFLRLKHAEQASQQAETAEQALLQTRWSSLLLELEDALTDQEADLRKFALFETFLPFKDNDLMMLVADSILTRAKQLILNEVPVRSRPKLADAIGELSILFKHGTSEEQLMRWLDDLAMEMTKVRLQTEGTR